MNYYTLTMTTTNNLRFNYNIIDTRYIFQEGK